MNTPLVIGAFIVSIVVAIALVNIIKTTLKTALVIALIIFALQIGFGVGPADVWKQVQKMLEGLVKWLRLWGNKNKPPADFRDNDSLLLLIPIVLESWFEIL